MRARCIKDGPQNKKGHFDDLIVSCQYQIITLSCFAVKMLSFRWMEKRQNVHRQKYHDRSTKSHHFNRLSAPTIHHEIKGFDNIFWRYIGILQACQKQAALEWKQSQWQPRETNARATDDAQKQQQRQQPPQEQQLQIQTQSPPYFQPQATKARITEDSQNECCCWLSRCCCPCWCRRFYNKNE